MFYSNINKNIYYLPKIKFITGIPLIIIFYNCLAPFISSKHEGFHQYTSYALLFLPIAFSGFHLL